MNILLVAYYYPPINSAGSQRPLQMARWLRQAGHSACVLTHHYGRDAIFSPEIIRVPDPAFARCHRGAKVFPWAWRRGLAELLNYCGRYASIFSPWKKAVLARLDEIGRQARPDLVLATYPPLEDLELGLEISRRFHVPLLSDFRDGLLFRSIEEKRLRSHRCVQKKYREVEAVVASASELITAVTPALKRYFADSYPGCRCEVVYNGYDPEEWLELPAVSLPPGAFHIVHTGRLSLSDSATDIGPLVAALNRLGADSRVPPFSLDLVGALSRRERAQLRSLTRAGRTTIRSLTERRQSLAYQQSADLLLLVTRPGTRSGIPLKLFEYLNSGKPVLALSDDGEIQRIIEECGCGWCVPPADESAITRALTRILTDPAIRARRGPRSSMIAGFSWERQMGELNRLLASLENATHRGRAGTTI